MRTQGVNYRHWDARCQQKYKDFYKLSKMHHQEKEDTANAVSRHFAVNAVDDVTVLTSFLDEVKRQQEDTFDVPKAAPRIIRQKTAGDSRRGGRVAPYASTLRTFRDMILLALNKLEARTGTAKDIREVIEAELPYHIKWATHGRTRTWERTFLKRLTTMPDFVQAGENAKGETLYTVSKSTEKTLRRDLLTFRKLLKE